MSYLALFDDEEFISHAGLKLGWKIEMDALYTDDWRCLAKMIMEYETRPFRKAVGIPRGGVRLGQMLNEYATGNPDDPVLIVDDVYTTGASFKEFISENYLVTPVICWVVFARNPIKGNINTLFQMPSKIRKKLK
jgi:orotate phosphoribosyltransferase-like protein